MVHFIHIFAIFAEEMNQFNIMDEVREIFTNNHGYARMMDLKQAGIHTRKIAAACEEGIIEKIKPGLYKLVDYPWDEYVGFTDIYVTDSHAVICLISASDYYGLTTFNPTEISVAIRRDHSRFKLTYPPVKMYFFSKKYYESGIITIATETGKFNIYSVEKTIVDLFRFRTKLGDDIVLESLKNYLQQRNRNINRLIDCARQFRIENAMLPYIRAMII